MKHRKIRPEEDFEELQTPRLCPTVFDAVARQMEMYLEQRTVRVKEVDCMRVFRGDKQEAQKALKKEQQPTPLPTDQDIHRLAGNCSHFHHHYGFLFDPLTEEERQFPIAFSILTYKTASQMVDLLRAVYRPQNLYCIHADKKSPPAFRQAVEAVSRCFPNVFMASRSIDIHWSFYTVLEPEIVCMGDLWRNKTWKYFINLTGQEFPLRTNYELVRILTAFNGVNDIAGRVPDEANQARWHRFLPAPHNITVHKGPVHIVASRAFVDYVLHAPPAQEYLRWCQKTRFPEEHFFNSLNHNPHLGAPGRRPGNAHPNADFERRIRSLVRYKNWVPGYPCPGHKVVRGICILNVLDLPTLYHRRELFANKFHADYSRLALRCLAEELHNRTHKMSILNQRYESFQTLFSTNRTGQDSTILGILQHSMPLFFRAWDNSCQGLRCRQIQKGLPLEERGGRLHSGVAGKHYWTRLTAAEESASNVAGLSRNRKRLELS
ncbi:beta-1,3-galactosyl-O-glycosyl-glycoprotein beta-1,6-N-acetylglucosaminyltransferase 3-like [Babylonia areolata]|uniref:beta-1,3-galactosyl-O-glycosyl-glycoprotein beta-1,6-N-acetylglucosaminyltransferase 3-like n=1 Tax=Babylonia areolata TaxID=304850 RepID=UPI003FD61ADD